jgi:nitroimidazol reductase NimA-like FMN-containing flavoprotein (pyridoxamine 5'-phosphate oxidase superfamily)
MTNNEPVTELDPRFSSPDAAPTAWAEAVEHLQQAEIFWLTTVRPDGRPHVTPLLAAWVDEALHFCTGESERKAKNLLTNPQCVLTTGSNSLNAEGLDLVIEGEAARVVDDTSLQRIADAYEAKYGRDWRFEVRDGAFHGAQGNVAVVYRVAPARAFGFGKGASFSQTRWRFEGSRA